MPFEFGSLLFSGSPPARDSGIALSRVNGAMTPLLPGFRSVDMGSLRRWRSGVSDRSGHHCSEADAGNHECPSDRAQMHPVASVVEHASSAATVSVSLNNDGFVGFGDLLIVLSEWGTCK